MVPGPAARYTPVTMISLTRVVACASLLFLSACDESDAVSVRLRIAPDFSGSVTVSSLSPKGADALLRISNDGVAWKSQVELRAAAGDFARISALRLSDMEFSGGEAADGLCFLRVRLPRGESARWVNELVPLNAEQRKDAARALDPKGEADGIGETIKLEVTLPAKALGNGLSGRTRGVKLDADNEVVTLTVPVTTATTAGEPLVWHITWQK